MESSSQMSAEALKAQRLYRWVKRASHQLIVHIKTLVAFGALLLVVLLSIPWSNAILRKEGLSGSTTVLEGAITIVVVAIFFEVRALTERENSHIERRHFADPMDVYPVLLDRIHSIKRQDEKKIDVIGMTLYTAWPSIKFWLSRSELNGWTVRMAAVVHGEKRLSTHVPNAWFRDSRANLNDIQRYATAQKTVTRRITLSAYGYDFMPVVHGYRLGNGDLFYSLLRWDGGTEKLSLEGYSYEFIPADDRSLSAEAIREVFESWFQQTTRTPWSGTRSVKPEQKMPPPAQATNTSTINPFD